MTSAPLGTSVVLRAQNLSKIYPSTRPGGAELVLFRGLNLMVAPGEMIAIVGESGAGKSSLLHIFAALDRATSGEVWCGATEVTRLSGKAASLFRNREVGYVWQFHYLLPEFTAIENVAMPLLARGSARKPALSESRLWLERVGLGDRADHRSGELSGGEQQRVSVARALVTQPKLLLADEPTGDLDNTTAERVFTLIQELQREHGLAGILVTHNLDFAARCDRVLRLRGGALAPA